MSSERNTSNTANVAREVLSEVGDTSPSQARSAGLSNAEINDFAANKPWRIADIESLAESDRDNPTARAAAVAAARFDGRPYELTAQGMVRRQFDDHGSATRRAAREMADLFEYGKDRTHDPDGNPITHESREAHRHARALHDFARDVNASTMDSTLPIGGQLVDQSSDAYHQSADAVADAIVRRGRDSQ